MSVAFFDYLMAIRAKNEICSLLKNNASLIQVHKEWLQTLNVEISSDNAGEDYLYRMENNGTSLIFRTQTATWYIMDSFDDELGGMGIADSPMKSNYVDLLFHLNANERLFSAVEGVFGEYCTRISPITIVLTEKNHKVFTDTSLAPQGRYLGNGIIYANTIHIL